MSKFIEISPYEIDENIFKMIGKDWMLITAKANGKINTMTASWGGAGILWNKPVAFTFIRPQRYTYEFTEASERMTLSFFDEKYRDALTLCGRKSGRDMDKIAAAGLSVVENGDAPYFDEAKTVLVCRKIYADTIKPEAMTDKSFIEHYPINDFHKMYICEIEKVLIRE